MVSRAAFPVPIVSLIVSLALPALAAGPTPRPDREAPAVAEVPVPLPRPADLAPEPTPEPQPVPPRAVEAEATGPEIDATLPPADEGDAQAAMEAESLPEPALAPEPPPNEALVITRMADGALTLAGVLADERAELALMKRARAAAGDAMVSSAIRIAATGARSDLDAVIGAGLSALEELDAGTVTIRPGGLEIAGTAEDEATRERVAGILAAQPWQTRIELPLPLVRPYDFRAAWDGDALTYEGHAPDEDTARALASAIAGIAGAGATGSLTLARGMPDEDWPELVEAGLSALLIAERGTLKVTDALVRIEAEVADAGDARRVEQRLGADWEAVIVRRDTAPDPELTLTIRPGEALSARGRLPARVSRAELDEMVGPVETPDGLAADGYGERATWQNAINALSIAVPRIEAGQIVLTDGNASFEGALKDGFSAAELSAALRATLGPGWETGIALTEAPPASQVVVVKSDEGVDVDGIVPSGVAVEPLLASLGPVDLRDLAGGGDGERDFWAAKIGAAGRALRAFDTGLARLDGREAVLSGTLGPGYTPDQVSAWLKVALGPEWTVAVNGGEQVAAPGARRIDFVTGHSQEERDGRWVTVHDFPVSPDRCAEVMAEAKAGEEVGFRPGSALIADGQEPLLDRLAALAGHCAGKGRLRLTVGGHTDSEGDPGDNLALSEARALAVAQALAERGVPPQAMLAVGHGDTAPVADNATPEGRAANRRVTFDFSEG